MRGVFSKLPADSLAAALVPVAARCEGLDWAVDLYSGPLQYPYYDEADPRNVVSYHHAQDGLPMGWFGRGFLPRFAECLILDEWSYYLGFDSSMLGAAELAHRLSLCRGMQPKRELFDLVAAHDLLYVLRVDSGWWEAYTPDAKLADELCRGWDGTWVDSERWNDGVAAYPGALVAT